MRPIDRIAEILLEALDNPEPPELPLAKPQEAAPKRGKAKAPRKSKS